MLAGDLNVRFDFTDPTGSQSLDSLQVGNDFLIQVHVQDVRSAPTGVRQAYFDVFYDSSLASVNGAYTIDPLFNLDAAFGDTSTPGLIDEAGGIDSDRIAPVPPNTELLLFSVPFHADAPGQLELTADLSEFLPRSVLFLDSVNIVQLGDIDFQGGSIEIVDAGVLVSPTSGLSTTEAGVSDAFDVVLTSQPTADVTFSISSSNTNEGTVSASSVTFTSTNWDDPQTFTVTGVDDFQDDGDVAYTIITGAASSSDARFNNVDVDDVSVLNFDDDTVGIDVTPAAGLLVTEAGGLDTFDVSLTSQPTSNVTIGLSSNNTLEGTISTNSLVFTTSNWNDPQTVTVTGVDDFVDDGDAGFSIITAPATSGDSAYNGFNADNVSVTNTDNDAAGITVSPLSGTTSEAGGTQTISVRLDSQPTADVVIGITSSNTDEGTVSESSLTFTPANWDDAQLVVITGVDDDVDDGNQSYQVVTAPATGSDLNYIGRNAADVAVTNTDDDALGFIVNPVAGLVTTEAGGSDVFTIRLRSQPTADVSIALVTSDPTEGSIDKASLVFTPANWDTQQTVTVTGVDDDVDDGSVAYSIQTSAVSTDTGYSRLNPDDVSVTNTDDDVAGITVVPTSGLITNENGGAASFDVVLTSQPTSTVTIGVSSSDTTEGTVSVSSLTFDEASWDIPQTVTITGENDDMDDGDVAYTIVTAAAVSTDPSYRDRDVSDVSVINTDDDAVGVLVAPTSGLITSEPGGSATFMVELTAQPSADVTISLASSNEDEGTISAASVTFTPDDWDTAQELTITGVDDAIEDGDVAYTIVTGATASTDTAFDGLIVDDVQVTNSDDDSVAIVVEPTAGLVTSEAGQIASFEVSLGSQPSETVTIGLISSDNGEGTLDTSSVTFTPQNWNIPQSVTVTGVDDLVDDGDVAYSILTAAAVSDDTSYNGLDGPNVSVTNLNDDTAGAMIVPVAGLQTTESGNSATFTVVLTSQPVFEVAIGISSSDTTEGTVDTASVTFDASNWDTPQTITVTGVDDVFDDGDIGYSIVTASATSSDMVYSRLDASDVSVTNIDDDVPGIAIVPTAGLETSEQLQTATFDVVLTSLPTADVVIELASSNTNEGTVSVSTVTFTPDNFDTPQTVTVQGVDDNVVDGAVAYLIETSVVSTDPVFSSIDPPDVGVTNLDDDTATLSVTPVSAVEGTPDAETMFVFDVILLTAVASSFTVDFATADGTAIAADNDYITNSGMLNFVGNQDEVQSITVVVNQDTVVEGDETFQVSLENIGGIASELAQRIMLPGSPVQGTITNDDTAELTIVGPAPTLEGTSETATTLDFTVQLSAAVQGGFTLAYNTDDGTALLSDDDYTDNDGSLAFVGNVGETQTISVAVRADDRIEPDETFGVTLGALSDLPTTAADDITVATTPVSATIVNDDFPQLILTDVTANRAEGTGGTTTEFVFEVTLTDAVADADGFEVPFMVDDGTATVAGGDYTDNDGSLQFAGSAGETQTITVLVNHDATVEADETFIVTLGTIVGLDPSQTVVVPVDTLESTIENDDTASLTLTATSASGTEGDAYELTVSLSAAVQGGFMVDYGTSDGSATLTDGDYTQASDTLLFNGTVNESQTFSLQSQQDAKVELDEIFTVALQALSGLPASAASAIAISDPLDLTILNDDSATITLSAPAATNEGSDGSTTSLVFEVLLSAPVQGGFSIGHQTVDGTATSASDFVTNDDTLVFSGDAETQTVTVQVNADSIVEGDETFQVTLGGLVDLLAGLEDDVTVDIGSATGTILNDDTATLSITGPGVQDEGTADVATEFVFTVTLSAAVQDGVIVAYNTEDGTATLSDNDFQDNDGSLPFDGTLGETQTITVAVTADDRVELDETFSVTLGAISGLPPTAADAVTLAEGTAAATIQNDDFARLVLSDVTASTVEGSTEAGTTEFQFTVTLTDAVNDPDGFEVPLMINDGTATVADGDFQDNDVVLQFDGTAMETKTVTVFVNHDLTVETDETFTVDLGEIDGLASGETVLLETTSLTATIEDDDSATLTLTATGSSIDEGDSGTTDVVFDVSLSAPVQGGFLVPLTTNDLTATVADGDYVDNDVTLNFAGTLGETQQITVQINGDPIVESDEMFEVALGIITGLDATQLERLTVSGSPIAATIINDDTATLTITGPGNLSEGTGTGTTAFDYTVTLSHPISSSFDVSFQTLEGTATVADNDFIDNDGSLTFAGNAEAQTISVLVNQDSRVEGDETFQVALGPITGLDSALAGLLTVDSNPVTATIENDDTATIAFVAGSSSVFEADGQLNVAVRLDVSGVGTLSEPAIVNVVVRDGGTASPSDFTLTTTTITFPADSADGATQNVQLTFTQDNLVEDVETIVLGLELAPGGLTDVSLGSVVVHTVSVTDDNMDAVLSGRVWVDANDDGTLNLGELTIPSVAIRLSGTTLGGDTIDLQTTTDSSGFYQFDDLPAGTYSISQTQPAEFIDGQDMLGTVGGATSGAVGEDQFSGIEVSPSQVGSGFYFGERGLHATQVNRFRFLARPRTTGVLGDALTSEMLSGNQPAAAAQSTDVQASSLTSNTTAEGELVAQPTASQPESLIERFGSQLIVLGTSGADRIRIVPAANHALGATHVVEVNGESTSFDAAEIDSILVVGSEGADELVLEDTPNDDLLHVERDRVILESDDLRIEAIAIELVSALSSSGGRDQVLDDSVSTALDYVLQLEGDWDRLDSSRD